MRETCFHPHVTASYCTRCLVEHHYCLLCKNCLEDCTAEP